jgi:hypothetical protein
MNKIIIVALISIFSIMAVYANFDNFTNWGDVPVASEQPSGVSNDVLTSFTGFEAGRKNGQPQNPSAPLVAGEFHTLDSNSDNVVVSSAVEFPQRLKPKQTVQIKLGTRPLTAGVSLKFAMISDKLNRNEYMTYRFDNAERPICVKINGTTLYHRNISDGRVEQEIFIPFYSFVEGQNILEITNEGNFVVAFDYLRLQLASEGSKVFLAFASDDNSSPPSLNNGLPIEVAELSLPSNAITNAPSLGSGVAPSDFEASYAAMNEFFSLGYVKGKKYGVEFNNWAAIVSKILKQGKLPYIRIKGDLTKVNEKTVAWFLSRYGTIVGGWICDNEVSAEVLSKHINGVNIVAVDIRDTAKVMTAANTANTYSRTYAAPVSVKGGRQDRVYGDFMQQYLLAGKNFQPAFVPFLTPSKPLINHQAVIDNGEETITAVLQILMHGGRGVLIDSGNVGANIIVNAKTQPVQQTLSKLFELASGDGALLPMSLALENHIQGNPLEDTYYAATKNSDEEITVVVLNGRKDLNRDVKVIVPVAWSGASTIIHRDYTIDEIGQGEPTLGKTVKKVSKVHSPVRKKGVEIGSLKGVVSYQFKTAGLSIIKLQRYKSKEELAKKTPEQKTVATPNVSQAQSFTVLPYNFIYVPVASQTNLQDLVSFAKENISAYGPKGTGVIDVKPSEIAELDCISAPESFGSAGVRFVARKTPIWADNSIFLEFTGAKRKQRPSYILNLGTEEYLKGADGFFFFAKANPIVQSVSERLSTSSKPVTFAIGSRINQLIFSVPVDKPTLIYVPYSSVMGVMNDPSVMYLMMDTKEQRDIRLELNSIFAAHKIDSQEPKLAVRYDLYEKALYMLVEGDTGKPLSVCFRLKDKFNLTKASPIMPHGFTKVKLDVDVERNQYGIFIEKLSNNDGKKGNVSKYFPTITDDAPTGRTRVLIKFAAER